MHREFQCLSEAAAGGWETLEAEPFSIHRGTIGSTETVCAVSGVGKVAAAGACRYLMDRYAPGLIVSFGLAGGLDQTSRPGEIVFPETMLQGDTGIYDRRGLQTVGDWPDGRAKRLFHHQHQADPHIFSWGVEFFRQRGIDFHTGPLATCDQAVFSNHRRRELAHLFGAVAVDMESGAIAQVAAAGRVPMVVVRAISDAHELEMENCEEVLGLQSDALGAKVASAFRVIRHAGHREFIAAMRKGGSLACETLARELPVFLELCPIGST